MSKKSDIKLNNFFIFNADYGPQEGEEEKKIMFYHPSNACIDQKIKQIGLCEAITKFTFTFTDHPCESMHTEKTRQLFFEPETSFWIIMTVGIPFSTKSGEDGVCTEYHDEDVQDCVYRAVLKRAYSMFTLFNGSFTDIARLHGVEGLKQRLDQFFSKYLPTLKLHQSDILDIFNGIHFLPLDKNTYLRVQCFVNQLAASFAEIQYSAFLYNDQLVWSGLEQEEMRVLYHYLTTSLFPKHLERELQGSGSSGSAAATRHYGKFILGPPNLNDDSNNGKIPRVFIGAGRADCEQCHLVVYCALGATVCLLLRDTTQLTFDFWRRLDKVLGPKLGSLASDIGEQFTQRSTGGMTAETPFRYVYFNHMNLAMKTTVHNDAKKSSGVAGISPEIVRILAALHEDLNKEGSGEEGETIVKTASDWWVVAKKADQREFYVILNQKNSNLLEINEEVKKLCAAQFSNIFFMD